MGRRKVKISITLDPDVFRKVAMIVATMRKNLLDPDANVSAVINEILKAFIDAVSDAADINKLAKSRKRLKAIIHAINFADLDEGDDEWTARSATLNVTGRAVRTTTPEPEAVN